jgi:soluble lytic murein transglycosylase-like protein
MKNILKSKRTQAILLVSLLTFSAIKLGDIKVKKTLKAICDFPLISYKESKIDYYLEPVYQTIKTPEIISRDFIRSVIITESRGKKKEISYVGARGLMQIMPGTWNDREKEITFEKGAFDPYINIKVGIKHLNWLKDYCEKRHPYWKILPQQEKQSIIAASYNGGHFRLWTKNWDISRMPKETIDYVKKVQRNIN